MAYGVKKGDVRLPPGCGEDLEVPYLYNPYLHDPEKGFFAALRKRVCLKCHTLGFHDDLGQFHCPTCKQFHISNLTAPRAFDKLLLLAGRGGGKTLAGAHAVRQELMIPNSTWWVMGPTFKILWDSTFPTLIRLIKPEWVKHWDAEHAELTLVNGSKAAFRSLEDPERARGPHGVAGGWFDEAAQSPKRAYDVFEPTLIKAGGIIIASTTVLGFDWTYDEIEKRALVYKEPGYWTAKWWTEENPLFRSNPVMMRQIEQKRRTSDPSFFAQEYRAERNNATGLIYDYSIIERQTLLNDAEITKLIPEWPNINPSRTILIGLDSGVDHPFGAVKIVVTERGLVVVGEYLERQKAISQHLDPIVREFKAAGYPEIKWSANKNEANLRLEFGLRGVGVIPAENKHQIGIQRVQSWLYAKKLFFTYLTPKTVEQMRAYRQADNTKPTGEKKKTEEVFKFKDELPDAVRYAIMAWPELPELTEAVLSDTEQARWDALDEKSRQDIERMREYAKVEAQGNDLDESDENYPVGDMWTEMDTREWQ